MFLFPACILLTVGLVLHVNTHNQCLTSSTSSTCRVLWGGTSVFGDDIDALLSRFVLVIVVILLLLRLWVLLYPYRKGKERLEALYRQDIQLSEPRVTTGRRKPLVTKHRYGMLGVETSSDEESPSASTSQRRSLQDQTSEDRMETEPTGHEETAHDESAADMSFTEYIAEESGSASAPTTQSFSGNVLDPVVGSSISQSQKHRRQTTKDEGKILSESLPSDGGALSIEIMQHALQRLGSGWDENRLKIWYRNNVRRRLR